MAHNLNTQDPIFHSIRDDYCGFDQWLAKCHEEHRDCWTVENNGDLAALTIVKDETPAEFGPGGKTLKICLFKVSEEHPGLRYGELLLKSVFDYAYENSYESAYLTVFFEHSQMISTMANLALRTPENEPVNSFRTWNTQNILESGYYACTTATIGNGIPEYR